MTLLLLSLKCTIRIHVWYIRGKLSVVNSRDSVTWYHLYLTLLQLNEEVRLGWFSSKRSRTCATAMLLHCTLMIVNKIVQDFIIELFVYRSFRDGLVWAL